MITDERMETALRYLVDTDNLSGDLKAEVARKEYAAKLARARIFLMSEGSVEARKAQAEVSADVQAAEEELAKAIVADTRTQARRKTEVLVIDTWRSQNANRRVGNL